MFSSDENKCKLDEFSLLCWYFGEHVPYVMWSWSQAATVKYIFKLIEVYQQKQTHSEFFLKKGLVSIWTFLFLVFNINHATFGMSSPLQEAKKTLYLWKQHIFSYNVLPPFMLDQKATISKVLSRGFNSTSLYLWDTLDHIVVPSSLVCNE